MLVIKIRFENPFESVFHLVYLFCVFVPSTSYFIIDTIFAINSKLYERIANIGIADAILYIIDSPVGISIVNLTIFRFLILKINAYKIRAHKQIISSSFASPSIAKFTIK